MKKQLLATLVLSVVATTSFASNDLGHSNVNTADDSLSIGTRNTVNSSATSSFSAGTMNTATGANSIVFGESNKAVGTNSFAGGNDSVAKGRNSFAYGSHAVASVEYTVAIGSQAMANAYDTIAIGNGAYANGESTVVIGRTNTVKAENSTVIGSNNGEVKSGQGVVVGYSNKVLDNSKEQLILGANSQTKNQGATVVGSHSQAVAVDSLALGNNAVADVQNSVALGTNSTTEEAISTDHIFINGERYDFAGGVANSTVSVGATNKAGYSGVSDYKRTITNVGAGRVDSTSTDAINGSQLNAVINALKFTTVAEGTNTTVKQSTNIDGGKEFSVSVNKDLTNMKSVEVGTVNDAQRNFMTKEGNHVFNNEVNTLYSANGMKLENTDNLDTASVDLNGLVADSNNKHVEFTTNNVSVGKQQIHDVQAGVNDTDAVNVSQLKQAQLGVSNQMNQMNTQINAQMNQMNNNINQVNTRMNRLGASSASLAGLHPLDFNRNDKASYAISYGHYRNSNAVAIGAFYRPNERVMIGAGMSLGAENQYTLNVAFKTGKGSDYINEAKSAQSRISSLESLVAKLTQEVAELKSK